MHGIESFRLPFGDVQHLHADDAKFVLQQRLDNVACRVPFKRVRLNDRQSTLDGFHECRCSLFAFRSWLPAVSRQLNLVLACLLSSFNSSQSNFRMSSLIRLLSQQGVLAES